MFQAWKAYRKANPRSRAPGAIIYVKNTAKTKRQGCVLCGARGPSWAAEWRKTRAAETWEAEHDCSEHILRETYNPTLAFKRLVTEANR
jgi:hypothetical protein